MVGAGPAALRAAIACADSGTSPLLIDASGVGSASGAHSIAGIAASIDELDSSAHREDTISAGGESTDKISAARVCGEGVATLAELERWGLVLRTREGGLPHAYSAPGHSVDRMTGCGDSTTREVTRILEEQAIKRGIQRWADTLPIRLAVDNQQVRGIITMSTLTGEIVPIQAKSVILATEGHQGLWATPNEGAGTGASLALRAGISLRGMESTPLHPLSVRNCDIHIPIDVLGSGARIRRESGEDVGPEEVLEGEPCVLDMRAMEPDSATWFSQIASDVSERLGIDVSREVIPITAGVAFTTGGIPCDEFGRVTFDGSTGEGQPSRLWLTGLYAAGRSGHFGTHGEGPLPGNILLEDLVTGKAAGVHASGWSAEAQFGGPSAIDEALRESSEQIESMRNGGGLTVGQFATRLSNAMASSISSEQTSSQSAISSITEILDEGIRITDDSVVMNTEMVTAIRLDGLANVANSIFGSV